jgi:hypothetical protein
VSGPQHADGLVAERERHGDGVGDAQPLGGRRAPRVEVFGRVGGLVRDAVLEGGADEALADGDGHGVGLGCEQAAVEPDGEFAAFGVGCGDGDGRQVEQAACGPDDLGHDRLRFHGDGQLKGEFVDGGPAVVTAAEPVAVGSLQGHEEQEEPQDRQHRAVGIFGQFGLRQDVGPFQQVRRDVEQRDGDDGNQQNAHGAAERSRAKQKQNQADEQGRYPDRIQQDDAPLRNHDAAPRGERNARHRTTRSHTLATM